MRNTRFRNSSNPLGYQLTTTMAATYLLITTLILVFTILISSGALSVGLGIAVSKFFENYFYYSRAHQEILTAPSLSISHPPTFPHCTEENTNLVFVSGIILAESKPTQVLKSENFDGDLVASEINETPIYKEPMRFLGWRGFSRLSNYDEYTTLTTVPFVIAESGESPCPGYMSVNLDGSRHSLPLTTIDQCLIRADKNQTCPFLWMIFGSTNLSGVLKEEKILPVGKEITAFGFCSMKDGIPQIKSSKDLPVFITDISRNELLFQLWSKKYVMLCCGTVLGTISVGFLSYVLMRINWVRWKTWLNNAHEINGDKDADGPESCLICFREKRACAFIPCGHHVCCLHCSNMVMIKLNPNCPICRQKITSHIRIYSS